MADRFADRNVVVTGAAGGIGLALSKAFAREGARVAMLDLDPEGLANAASALPEGRCLTEVVDVRDADACAQAIARVTAEWGGIDVLINNAGISHRSLFRETDTSVLRRVMDVNFFGAVHCTSAALPSIVERQGLIVAISSVAGFAPLIGRTGYCASKHALHGFFDSLRTELQQSGADVMVVCPSFTATKIESAALTGDGRPIGNAPRASVGSVMSPDMLAKAIVDGAARRARLLTPSGVSRVSWWLSRLAPRLYDTLMLRSQREELAPPSS